MNADELEMSSAVGSGHENSIEVEVELRESAVDDEQSVARSETERDERKGMPCMPWQASECRKKPIAHSATDAPLCQRCQQSESPFFNFECDDCRQILSNADTSIGQILAIMRQWVPQTQQSIEILIEEVMRRGAHVNDRDSLTDMTLLHYACKSGSTGVGDADSALRAVRCLLESCNADISLRCRWTDMSAIHYAVYFDVAPVLQYLLHITHNKYIDNPCRDFDGGTPLHIAATNMCLSSAKILLKNGANVLLKDDLSRTPLDCVPDSLDASNLMAPEVAFEICCELKKLLEEATLAIIPGEGYENLGLVTGKVVLQALGLNLGDRVIISNTKVGILRYCGATQFATSIWAGIELDEPEGKNDGTVGGITYFRCPPKHGIFAPINKISRYDDNIERYKGISLINGRNVNHPRIDVSHVTPKVKTGLLPFKSKNTSMEHNRLHSISSTDNDSIKSPCNTRKSKSKATPVKATQSPPSTTSPSLSNSNTWLTVGVNVFINNSIGVVRYIGPVHFADGTWLGVELRTPNGKNDGSVQNKRYFQCKQNYGLLVRPKKVSVRGINGAKLLPE